MELQSQLNHPALLAKEYNMTYRKEATTRILYFLGVAAISGLVGLIVAAIVATGFKGVSHLTHERIVNYSGLAAFLIVCSALVYMVDKKLTKRFNKNP